MTTRTGNFPIGFRRGWGQWQKDLASMAQWAKNNGFEAIDLGRATAADAKALQSAGLRLGSVDLIDFGGIMANDEGKRKDVIAQNVAYVKEAAGFGAKVFFTVIIPGDVNKKRSENYALAVKCYQPIIDAAAQAGATVAVEGWPGGYPHLANLCCTPETYRAFLKDTGGKGVGINYDPSHLIRLHVDHIRFLKEFAPFVKHVHGKDTDLNSDMLYEVGPMDSVFRKAHGFGEWTWRYTIPGQGVARWVEICSILKQTGYQGMVSVELEDENFNGSEAGEKAGFLNSLAFLKGV